MEWLMPENRLLSDNALFSKVLFGKMKSVSRGIEDLELYEFRFGLAELVPAAGWGSIHPDSPERIESRVTSRDFYESIQIKPVIDGKIALDAQILNLSQMLFVGLVTGMYLPEWVCKHFYFDIRSFIFLHRTQYFTDRVKAYFGGHPYRSFEEKQKCFEPELQIGYKEFKEANHEVDQFLTQSVQKMIAARGTPTLLAIAGATAAGKTEIVERLVEAFQYAGQKTTSIEMDNFFLDRDYREAKGFYSHGKEALHFGLFLQALDDITHHKKILTPRYNFLDGSSSHALTGYLKPGCEPVTVEPADVIFIEGNFPFLLEEVSHLIGIKVIYQTDDPIRLKRKWRRDMDYRKKYDISYFRNRYFREQFIMAQEVFLPQLEICDMAVDTTAAAVWVTPETARILEK
jgi:uridine kinase